MKGLIVFLANAAAVLSVLGALLTLGSTFTLWPRLQVAVNADRYQRETLVVDRIVHESFSRKDGPASHRCYADGPAGATRERLLLTDCSLDPKGQVVTKQAAQGERIDVAVNRTIDQAGPSADTRTVRYRDDLAAQGWARVRSFLPIAYGPMLLPALLALLLGTVARVAFGARAGLWCLWPVAATLLLQGVVLAIALR
jgi:hypothetical protein